MNLISKIAVAGFGVVALGSAFSSIFLASRVLGLEEAINQVSKEIQVSNQPAAGGVQFGSIEDFHKAVQDGVEVFITQKQNEEMTAKYNQFEHAEEKSSSGKHIYGDPNARFTLVEFSDLECPFCKRFHSTPKEIVDNSNSNVNWQWKHLPLDFHNPAAKQEAHAAECVSEQLGNRAFWVFVNDIFEHTQGNGQGVGNLLPLVQGVGADPEAFRQCMNNNTFMEKIEKDVEQAGSQGISGTPATFVVDNVTGRSQVLSGAQPPEAIVSVIRRMMASEDE